MYLATTASEEKTLPPCFVGSKEMNITVCILERESLPVKGKLPITTAVATVSSYYKDKKLHQIQLTNTDGAGWVLQAKYPTMRDTLLWDLLLDSSVNYSDEFHLALQQQRRA